MYNNRYKHHHAKEPNLVAAIPSAIKWPIPVSATPTRPSVYFDGLFFHMRLEIGIRE